MGMTIKNAATIIEIKYENAKAIHRVYMNEQRTDKIRHRYHKVKTLKKRRQRQAMIQKPKLLFLTSFELPLTEADTTPKALTVSVDYSCESPFTMNEHSPQSAGVAPIDSFETLEDARWAENDEIKSEIDTSESGDIFYNSLNDGMSDGIQKPYDEFEFAKAPID